MVSKKKSGSSVTTPRSVGNKLYGHVVGSAKCFVAAHVLQLATVIAFPEYIIYTSWNLINRRIFMTVQFFDYWTVMVLSTFAITHGEIVTHCDLYMTAVSFKKTGNYQDDVKVWINWYRNCKRNNYCFSKKSMTTRKKRRIKK